MNQALANMAVKALTAKGFETYKGYCSRWCRQVCEATYGDLRYNKYWRYDADPTAAEAGVAFQKAKFDIPKTKLQVGDILFKTTGEFGHVGIVVPFNGGLGVAENSTYHWNRHPGDARGIRTLEQFGAFQIAIRLPAPEGKAVAPTIATEPLLIDWNGQDFTMKQLIERGGHKVLALTEKLPDSRVYVRSTPKG